jgi:hypothetical protein
MDHEQKAKSIQLAIFKRMTYEEKYRQILGLRAFAWNLKKMALKADHSSWTDEQIEEKVCEIFLYART